MNIGPKSSFLRALRSERGDIVRLCGEAVDNAFDARAQNIVIRIDKDEIQFSDDGDGVLLDSFPALFTLGDHIQLKETRLGRFGVGITAQAINNANRMTVRSTSADGCFYACADWGIVERRGWEIPDPVRKPKAVGAETSTVITLGERLEAKKYTIEQLMADLARRFYPALSDGRRIHINGIDVPVLTEPPMTDRIECNLKFSDGRQAFLRGGILRQPSRLSRVHVSFGHRVIMPGNSAFGCGKYTGLSNMFARVQLVGDAWALSAFKDDIADESQRDELDTAIEAALRPLLEKCSNVQLETRIEVLGQLANHYLPDELQGVRPHRKKSASGQAGFRSGRSGAINPDDSDPEGPAKPRSSPKDRLIITFEGRNAEHGIGWFEPGRPNRVNLSRDNPRMQQLAEQRDDKAAAMAIAIIAVQLFEHGREDINPQADLFVEPFGVRIAKHLNSDGSATGLHTVIIKGPAKVA